VWSVFQDKFSPTDASQPYGIISSTTSLTVAEPGINQTTAYAFSKDGLNYVLSNARERGSKNKYSATVSSGQIQLHIHNTALYDEGTYSCSVGPTGDVAFYSLYVEGKPWFNTIITFLFAIQIVDMSTHLYYEGLYNKTSCGIGRKKTL